MEENYYRDEFELFLKGTADELNMVPSRKVWYSIYNNLHPDRKWPSMAVCLLILTAVLYLGISNNNSLSRSAKSPSSETFSLNLNEKNIDNKITSSAKKYFNQKNKQPFSPTIIKTDNNKIIEHIASSKIAIAKAGDYKTAVSSSSINKDFITVNTTNYLKENEIKKDVTNTTYQNKIDVSNDVLTVNKVDKLVVENEILDVPENNEAETVKLDNTKMLSQKNNLLNIEKSWKEDYAFRNKPAINKFKQNSTFSYYITPSFGYRTFSKSSKNIEPALPTSYVLARTNNGAPELFDYAALNLEVGGTLQYSISKKIRLISGLQANYTNYISNVTALGHPTQTSLTLNNKNNNIRSSNYSSKVGNDKINKSTLQIALPLGADFKIAGNEKLNWYVGGSIQPTYIIGGNAFVLSSDEKYYITENALLRKLNLNTSIETFVSFKTLNGVLLNVGPQFRYQLLSTYKKEYGYTEKIYNVGIKIGVTTTF